MNQSRPDLSAVDPLIREYIEALESEVQRLSLHKARRGEQLISSDEEMRGEKFAEIREPAEAPTTINLISATAAGIAKRTPRHSYLRQHRGGTGNVDLETDDGDPPAILALADESQNLLLLTHLGRAYRLPAAAVAETGLRASGSSLTSRFNLSSEDHLVVILPEHAQGYLALASSSGMVRMLRHHIFGEYMKPGAPLYDYRIFGPLAAACWTDGDGDLFLATRLGRAIRFAEKLVPPAGTRGIRLGEADTVVGIAPVYDDTGIFMLTAEGKGTIRLMNNFSPNKAPGAGGKIAMNTDNLVCALATDGKTDALAVTRQGKIIRFPLEDIPSKDAPVMGVNCLSLRADEPVAAVLA